MHTLLLVIGVNLVVFGATAIGRVQKGFKPFAGQQPLPPEQRTMTLALAALAVVAGIVMLVASFILLMGDT